MADKTFVYWTSNGERREVPIQIFHVPAGMKLISEETYLRSKVREDVEGGSAEKDAD